MFTTSQPRTLLLLIALVLFPALLSWTNAADDPAQDTKVYLPIVTNDAPRPDAPHVVGNVGVYGSYPFYTFVYGYLENRTSQPLYSVSLAVDVRYFSCYEIDPCDERFFTDSIGPAFVATLPNQLNPFRGSTYTEYKETYSFSSLRVTDVRRNPPDGQSFEALTIVRTERDESDPSIVMGVARNDSDHVLRDARVVVFARATTCPWQATILDNTTLAPGEETMFQANWRCSDVVAVGQGVVAD